MSAPVPYVVVQGGHAYSAGEVEVEVFDMDDAEGLDLSETIDLLERMARVGMSDALRGYAVEIIASLRHELIQQRPERSDPPLARLHGEPSEYEYAVFGRFVAVVLGASAEWSDPAGMLERFARVAGMTFDTAVDDAVQGSASAQALMWDAVAVRAGIDVNGRGI